MTEPVEIPVVKRFGAADRLYVQAQQIWVILTGFVMWHQHAGAAMPPTITYGDLALKMGHDDRRVGHTLARQLGIVAQFCVRNDLPALNVIVVNQHTKMPGNDVIVRPGRTVHEEQTEVFGTDWYSLRVPTTGTFRKVWEAGE